ncbi:MAG TPA: trypsin-like peptidase domain-containing protein, partial [Isosphaeraceae bacterium]|nr:trypsin-like peptidase domain-containing protein [Isosphaeraceae bacterium]
LVVSAAALVGSRGLTNRLLAAAPIPAESQKVARALSDAFTAVAESVKPSVVQISVERKGGGVIRIPGRGRGLPSPGPHGPRDQAPKDLDEFLKQFKRFFGPDFDFEKEQFGPKAQGIGSGFVYDDKGHILTNNHVVEGAGKITVTFHDGVEAAATVVGTDPQSDVAVIKVENMDYRPLPKGTSGKLRAGELVMAVGSPFGLDQTVTKGIISATERNNVGINEYESFLQTDAAINRGNSGGPLVDMEGRVVGINSAIATGSGLLGRGGNDGVGFAIPIDLAANVADKLIKDGKVGRARIGIALGPLSPALAKQLGLDPKAKGVVVNDIAAGSPAEKAGLKPGDIITRFNGKPVVNIPTFRMTVAASEVGKSFDLTYYRDGKERTTSIVPAPSDKVVFQHEGESSGEEPEAKSEPAKTSIDDFGLEVQPLTSELAKSLGFADDVKGLLVSSVKEGSPAEAAGIESGDVITRVVRDQKPQPVSTVKDFQDLAGRTDELVVYIQSSKGPSRFVVLSKKKD